MNISGYATLDQWNIKRILLAMVGVVLFMVVLFFQFKPDTQNTDLQPITLVNMPVKKAPEKTDFLAQENQSGAGKRITKVTTAKKAKSLAKEATAKATKPLTKVTLIKNTKLSADEKITTIDKKDSATRYYRYPTTPN